MLFYLIHLIVLEFRFWYLNVSVELSSIGTAPGALTTPSPHHNNSQQQVNSSNTNNNQQTTSSRQQIQQQVNNNPCISQSHTPPSSNNNSGPPSQPPPSGSSGTGTTGQPGASHQQPHPSPIPPHQPPNSGTSHGNWSATGGTLNYTANQNSMGSTGTAVASGDWQASATYGSPQQRVGVSSVAVSNVQQQHHTVHENQGPLSKSPLPEFWCSILYFELDTQVQYEKLTYSIEQTYYCIANKLR